MASIAPWVSSGQSWNARLAAFQISAAAVLTSQRQILAADRPRGRRRPIQPPSANVRGRPPRNPPAVRTTPFSSTRALAVADLVQRRQDVARRAAPPPRALRRPRRAWRASSPGSGATSVRPPTCSENEADVARAGRCRRSRRATGRSARITPGLRMPVGSSASLSRRISSSSSGLLRAASSARLEPADAVLGADRAAELLRPGRRRHAGSRSRSGSRPVGRRRQQDVEVQVAVADMAERQQAAARAPASAISGRPRSISSGMRPTGTETSLRTIWPSWRMAGLSSSRIRHSIARCASLGGQRGVEHQPGLERVGEPGLRGGGAGPSGSDQASSASTYQGARVASGLRTPCRCVSGRLDAAAGQQLEAGDQLGEAVLAVAEQRDRRLGRRHRGEQGRPLARPREQAQRRPR